MQRNGLGEINIQSTVRIVPNPLEMHFSWLKKQLMEETSKALDCHGCCSVRLPEPLSAALLLIFKQFPVHSEKLFPPLLVEVFFRIVQQGRVERWSLKLPETKEMGIGH